MNKKELFKTTEILKREADLLLKSCRLLNLLKKYGKVSITGSYRLNLMLNGDIDIHVVNPKFTKNLVLDILNKLIWQGFFRGYLFFDYIKFKRQKGFPRGYYIGLKRNFRNREWKIDIWFLRQDDKKEIGLMNFVGQNLNEKNRYLILKFKELRNLKNLDISSAGIYKLVLTKGITNTKRFLALVNKS